jgi:hypothetical protein
LVAEQDIVALGPIVNLAVASREETNVVSPEKLIAALHALAYVRLTEIWVYRAGRAEVVFPDGCRLLVISEHQLEKECCTVQVCSIDC